MDLVYGKKNRTSGKQVHDEVILEEPTESAEDAKAIVVDCLSKPFDGKNILNVDLPVDAKCAQNSYAANQKMGYRVTAGIFAFASIMIASPAHLRQFRK
ncbi:DNA-directed DNA polymerase [Sarracenia purpurea var. burkii]